MDSIDFSIKERGYHGARQEMEKEAKRLKEEGYRIISVVCANEIWVLFYERV